MFSYGKAIQDAYDIKLSKKTYFPRICQGCFLVQPSFFLKKRTDLMEKKKSFLVKRVKKGSKDQEGQGKASVVNRKKKIRFCC